MPRRQIALGASPAISSPRKRMDPDVGASAPETQLKSVVLPEPLGPMRPRISPCRTSNETSSRAVKPPKCFASRETVSTRPTHWAPGGSRALPGAWEPALLQRQRRRLRKEHGRLDLRERLRIDDLEPAPDHLVDNGKGALVLPGEPVAGRIELDAVPHDRAAVGDIGLARGPGDGIGAPPAVLLDGPRQHVEEEDPEVVEAHGDVGGDFPLAELLAVAAHQLLRHGPDARPEPLGLQALRGR